MKELMETRNKVAGWQDRLDIPVNVGFAGGDLPARYFAAAVVLFLTIAVLPPLKLTYSTLKIFALLASMSGTILLMGGLVFSRKTHFAGIMLIPTAFLMMGLAGWQWNWFAVLLGVIAFAWIAQNLITKRCGINKLLGIDSCSN